MQMPVTRVKYETPSDKLCSFCLSFARKMPFRRAACTFRFESSFQKPNTSVSYTIHLCNVDDIISYKKPTHCAQTTSW